MEDQVAPQEQFVTPSQAPQQGMYYSDPNGQRYNNPAEFDTAETQKYLDAIQQQAVQQQLAEQQEVAAKLSSQQINQQQVPQIPVPNFAELRKKALEDAIQQVTAKRTAPPVQPVQQVNQRVPLYLQSPSLVCSEFKQVLDLLLMSCHELKFVINKQSYN
jgi:hypothetical protein